MPALMTDRLTSNCWLRTDVLSVNVRPKTAHLKILTIKKKPTQTNNQQLIIIIIRVTIIDDHFVVKECILFIRKEVVSYLKQTVYRR